MVRVKSTPKHAVVTPQKCVIVHRNPIKYVVYIRKEYFLLDQQQREHKRLAEYKQHVHAPPKNDTSANTGEESANHRCNKRTTGTHERQCLQRTTRNSNKLQCQK